MMFIHSLCKAIQNVGYNHGPTCMTFRHYANASWRRDLAEAMFCVIGKGIPETDPDVVLIKSAIRQIHQSGEIHWDVPTTPEEIAEAAPFVKEIKHYADKMDRKAARRFATIAKRTLYLLTNEQKKVLREPLSPKRVKREIQSAMRRLPLENVFRFDELGIGYHHVDSNELVNRMIELGIVDLVSPGKAPTSSLIRLGPRFVPYMEKYDIMSRDRVMTEETWVETKERLKEQWK